MNPLTIDRARNLQEAIAGGRQPGADYIAGGTDMMQLLKDDVRRPRRLIDVDALGLTEISVTEAGLHLGALVRMADAADHPAVKSHYPIIAEALLQSASPQIRNLGTMGGNLLQRTRCVYFRDTAAPCNKRDPGQGCSAIDGINRTHAIFGGSADCVATHASDLAVALVALDTVLHLSGPEGTRDVPLGEFHLLPATHPDIETVLKSGEIITGVTVPAGNWTARSRYLKIRDRASFEFALVSAGAALHIADGEIKAARIAAGGVGTKPWRLPTVEKMLTGARPSARLWRAAGQAAGEGAKPLGQNSFKIMLLQNAVARVLEQTASI